MIDIARTIIRYHRRKRHILWLIMLVIIAMSVQPLIQGLALGEESYVMTQWMLSSIEIIGIIFVIYFASTIHHQYQDTQILPLLMSKRSSSYAYIGGILWWMITIMTIYTIIAGIALMISTDMTTITIFYQILSRLIIFSTMITISLFISLFASPYIAMMASLVIYGVSYSINFLLFITTQTSSSLRTHDIIRIVSLFLPRFDLLVSGMWSHTRRWAIAAHSTYTIIVISLTTISFSYSYLWRSSLVSTHDSNKKD